MRYGKGSCKGILPVAAMVIVIGSVWGLAEMSLGGLLHAIHLPQKGAIMGGLAVSLMAVFVAVTGRPLLVPLLGFIAALFKSFSAIIFGMPVLSPFVINPAIAIIMEALAFSLVMVVMTRAIDRGVPARAGAGFAAGFLGYALYATAASVLGLGIWPNLDLIAKIQLTATSALPIGIAGAAMLAAGYYLGTNGAPRLLSFKGAHPRLYYSASFTVALLCWTAVIFQGG